MSWSRRQQIALILQLMVIGILMFMIIRGIVQDRRGRSKKELNLDEEPIQLIESGTINCQPSYD